MATKKIQIIPPGYTDVCYPQTIASAVIEETNKRFMTDAERTKLSGVATGATNTQNHATNGSITVNGTQQVVYAHPTADGDKHVPATGTTNNGRVLKAGATAGSLSWGTLTAGDVGAVPTTRTVNGKALSANISITAGDVSAYSKAEIDGKIVDNLTTGGATNLLSAEQGKVLNSAIGQKADKTQISNPNLLINGDFQIWQRGISFGIIPSNTYVADRWNNNAGSSLTEKTISGIKHITASNPSGLLQIIEDVDGKLSNKVVTLSVMMKASTQIRFEVNGVSSNPLSCSDYTLLKFTTNTGTIISGKLPIRIQNAEFGVSTFEIKYAKLELGEIATPFSPRPIAEELAMCQRYCATGSLLGLPYTLNANEIRFFIPLPRLRKTPSLIAANMAVFVDGASQSGFTFDDIYWISNGVYLRAYKPNHGLTSKIYLYSSTAIFDADLY